MSGTAQGDADLARGPSAPDDAGGTAASDDLARTLGADGTAGDGQQPTAPTSDPSAAPRPLTSLTSLLGGAFEGGQTCDADGNCD